MPTRRIYMFCVDLRANDDYYSNNNNNRTISAHVGRKNKSDTSNNRGNWNHLKITQTIPEQKKQPHWALHTAESIGVKVQNIQHGK
jgi:hypothetical protein